MSLIIDRFADIKILRYKLPNFEQLSLKQKQYIYHLSLAALSGRDILFDQNGANNLRIRNFLEELYIGYNGDKTSPAYSALELYLKQVWFANGIHHHYSMDKFYPSCSRADFAQLVSCSKTSENNVDELLDYIYSTTVDVKRVSLDSSTDLLHSSAMNYYQSVSQEEAESYYAQKRADNPNNAPAFGLNSTLVKKAGKLEEESWNANGKYGRAIKAIIKHLEDAKSYAENGQQQLIIEKLVQYYTTGDLALFDEYSIAWVKENAGDVDFVNGFIEVYGDPLGIKGSWESIVNYKDTEGTKRTELLSSNAKWFEQNSPVDDSFKKEEVKGVSAKVINVAMLGGDCYPATPIGINLPNSEWIREQYGSKSVTIDNITQAYFEEALGNGMLEEFAYDDEEKARAIKYGELASNLHTDLHECLGHGSGKMLGNAKPEDLKNYYSTIEEARADLFALYFLTDEKLVNIGLIPSLEVGFAEYDSYMRNALLTQLTRVELGKDLEESHMRNRMLIANWAMKHEDAKGVLEYKTENGKTYVKIYDYMKLRDILGKLLQEVQRIKSTGDFEAAKQLVENYGVKIDADIHQAVLSRFKALNIAPYAGFVNPELVLKHDESGNLIDVEVKEVASYTEQMLAYSKNYGFLS